MRDLVAVQKLFKSSTPGLLSAKPPGGDEIPEATMIEPNIHLTFPSCNNVGRCLKVDFRKAVQKIAQAPLDIFSFGDASGRV